MASASIFSIASRWGSFERSEFRTNRISVVGDSRAETTASADTTVRPHLDRGGRPTAEHNLPSTRCIDDDDDDDGSRAIRRRGGPPTPTRACARRQARHRRIRAAARASRGGGRERERDRRALTLARLDARLHERRARRAAAELVDELLHVRALLDVRVILAPLVLGAVVRGLDERVVAAAVVDELALRSAARRSGNASWWCV